MGEQTGAALRDEIIGDVRSGSNSVLSNRSNAGPLYSFKADIAQRWGEVQDGPCSTIIAGVSVITRSGAIDRMWTSGEHCQVADFPSMSGHVKLQDLMRNPSGSGELPTAVESDYDPVLFATVRTSSHDDFLPGLPD